MTKNKVSPKRRVDVVFEHYAYLDGLTLQEALLKIKQWIQEYGGNATIDIGKESDGYTDYESVYTRIVGRREETDAEYMERLELEDESNRNKEARDKKEFERLSKLFGEKK